MKIIIRFLVLILNIHKCFFLEISHGDDWLKINESVYNEVIDYYARNPPTDETMVAEGNASAVDLENSRTFIEEIFAMNNPPETKMALDCGAGNGRVTKHILIHIFDKVDLVEQNEKYADIALDSIGAQYHDKLGLVYRTKVQDFEPDKNYDFIWIQGVLSHLGDVESIKLLIRCRGALNPKGIIVIKDNVCDTKSMVNHLQIQIHRPKEHYVDIIHAAALKVIKHYIDEDEIEDEFLPVHSFAVIPMPKEEWYETFSASNVDTAQDKIIIGQCLKCILADDWVYYNESFYNKIKDYFASLAPTDQNLVAEGNASAVDIDDSTEFIQKIFAIENPPDTKMALDCGSGNGRVTKNILIHIFDKVDLVDQNEQYTDIALDAIGEQHHDKLGLAYRTKLQDFKPDKNYDFIWIQGVLTYMSDEDCIQLLLRCRGALNHRGIIVVKDNVHDEKGDSVFNFGVTRSKKHYIEIFHAAALKVIQHSSINYYDDYYLFHTFALIPISKEEWYQAFSASNIERAQEKIVILGFIVLLFDMTT